MKRALCLLLALMPLTSFSASPKSPRTFDEIQSTDYCYLVLQKDLYLPRKTVDLFAGRFQVGIVADKNSRRLKKGEKFLIAGITVHAIFFRHSPIDFIQLDSGIEKVKLKNMESYTQGRMSVTCLERNEPGA